MDPLLDTIKISCIVGMCVVCDPLTKHFNEMEGGYDGKLGLFQKHSWDHRKDQEGRVLQLL